MRVLRAAGLGASAIWNQPETGADSTRRRHSVGFGASATWSQPEIRMTYEPLYERFEVLGSDGSRLGVEFIRSGFLAQGDRPELFFFRLDEKKQWWESQAQAWRGSKISGAGYRVSRKLMWPDDG